MTSGQMWNYIRKPAEVGRDGNSVRYILGGRGGQYVLESYIVMAVNMAVAVGFILLNEVPSVKQGIAKKGKDQEFVLLCNDPTAVSIVSSDRRHWIRYGCDIFWTASIYFPDQKQRISLQLFISISLF